MDRQERGCIIATSAAGPHSSHRIATPDKGLPGIGQHDYYLKLSQVSTVSPSGEDRKEELVLRFIVLLPKASFWQPTGG